MNLFWYNFWFTDYKYFYPLHQDKMLRTFFYIYVNYGMFFPTHSLLSTYWYSAKTISLSADDQYNFKAFRMHHTPYDEDDDHGTYKTRVKISCMYISRIWILRFADWFVLCFYSLRPKETNLVRKAKIKIGTFDSNLISVGHQTRTQLVKRIKFLLAYRFSRQLAVSTHYTF